MATTYYDSIAGKLTGEFTGDVQSDYMADPLGSVSGYVDGSGSVVNRYWYAPYGAKIAGTGSGADPDFLYRGAWGYRAQNRSFATHDIRARDYDSSSGTWTTVDPMWPRRPAYGYGSQNPVTNADPSGSDVYDDFAVGYVIDPWAQDNGLVQADTLVTAIGGCVVLPVLCDVPCLDDYLTFYISLHPTNSMGVGHPAAGSYEAGLSFSPPGEPGHNGWIGEMTWGGPNGGGVDYITVPQQAGQVLCMGLQIVSDGWGVFFLLGAGTKRHLASPPPYQFSPPGYQAYGKVLGASNHTSSACKTNYLSSIWGAIFAASGPAVWAPNSYTTTNHQAQRNSPWDSDMILMNSVPLASALRPWNSTKLCNNSQFADWNYNSCCNEGLDYTSHGALCCCGGTLYKPL